MKGDEEALPSEQHGWLSSWRCSKANHDKSVEEGRIKEIEAAEPHVPNPNKVAIAVAGILESTQEDTQGRAQDHHPPQRRVASNNSVASLHEMSHSGARTLAVPSPASTVVDLPAEVDLTDYGKHAEPSSPDPRSCHTSWVPCLSQLTAMYPRLRTMPAPPTVAILLACPISAIRPLKALFVPLQNTNGSPLIPFAPDRAPPLAFILDTATFLGSASVPLALICLGAALAKLKPPKRIRDLPVGAILALTIGRLILQPIIAIVVVEGLVRAGLIDEANKVLRFVMM
jgi:hypothetical protein